MTQPDFYRAFEDRFRGPAEVVEARLSAYLPFLRPVADHHRGAAVVDLGCGRGEWLALLKRVGIQAHGVDTDAEMLKACVESGQQVTCMDAIDYLAGLPDGSQCAVTAFHFVEHIPFDTLHVLAREAMRVLRPGGLLMLETPNPESLIVSTSDFHLDPSHGHPIPPKLLAFLAEFHGFSDLKILRLQERKDLERGGLSLWGVLTGTSPDYALIARKPGPPLKEEIAAYSNEYGVTLESLAIDYDVALRTALAHARDGVQAVATSTNEKSSEAHRAIAALEARATETASQLASLQAALEQMRSELHATSMSLRAVHQSRSWRVTAPLRQFGQWYRQLRGGGR